MYFGEGTGEYTGYDTYTCSGSCGTIPASAGAIRTNAASFAAFVTP